MCWNMKRDIKLPVLHTQKNLSAVFLFVRGEFQEKFPPEYSLAVFEQTAQNIKNDMFHSKRAFLT